MNIELNSGAVRLARGQTLKVHDGAGSVICAREGSIWVTEENSRKDVVLESGACFRLQSHGLALIQAFTDASVSLA
jgi:hypothetical protein